MKFPSEGPSLRLWLPDVVAGLCTSSSALRDDAELYGATAVTTGIVTEDGLDDAERHGATAVVSRIATVRCFSQRGSRRRERADDVERG